MPLVIEDGSLPNGAQSYISVATARAYAVARAVTLPVDESAVEVLLVKAMDYLESFRAQFQGTKTTAGQVFQWPRYGAEVEGFEVEATTIPEVLKQAQAAVACEIAAGLDVLPSGTGREVIRKKIDVLETEWAAGSGSAPNPVMRKVRPLLAPLFRSGGGYGIERV